MKRVHILLALGLLLTMSARASVLFYDDFQQFQPGTVLTSTNYLPVIGLGASVETNGEGLASTTVTASNLLNSTRLFFDTGTVPYQGKYRGDFNGGSLTAGTFQLTFDLTIGAVHSSSNFGGVAVSLLTTNIDSINGSVTNFGTNPLIFINDGGQVFVFTNNPSIAAPLDTVVQIGTWSGLQGTVMSNALTVNLTNNTFSYTLNNTVLTNMPLPGFVTNILSSVGLEVFEGFTETNALSIGNTFAFDNVTLTVGGVDTNFDIISYIAAAKGQFFEQLTAGAPSLSSTGWVFHSDVVGTRTNSILAASLVLSNGTVVALQADPQHTALFELNDGFTSQSALDGQYPSAAPYTLVIDTADQGTFRPTLVLPVDDYPANAPQIVNFAQAQLINSSTNFVLQWSGFTGATSNDIITLRIADGQGNPVLATPDAGESNVLNGTVTSFLIPSNTLAASTVYQGELLFVKRTTTETNSVPGALGLAGFFKQTAFPLMTLGGQNIDIGCSLTPAVGTNTVNTAYTATATISSNGSPQSGVLVNFAVIAGPNLGNSGTATTDGSGHALFSYTSSLVGTDIVQAAGSFSSQSFTCTATEVWLATNVPPVANCQNVTVPAGDSCQGTVLATDVNNGSTDSDGVIVNLALSPSGPFPLGSTPVTLTVTDNRGASNTCSAIVTVVDLVAPVITCPNDIVTNVPDNITTAVVNYPAIVATDSCSGLTSSNTAPASGSTFNLGTNVVLSTAVDAAGNTNTCTFNVIVLQTPPQADLAISGSGLVVTSAPNNTISYSFVVTNKGPSTATSTEFEDVLPSGATFGSAVSTLGGCVFSNGIVVCDIGTLASGDSATVSLVVTASVPPQVCNTGTVSSVVNDPVLGNNTAVVCLPTPINDLAVTAFKAPKKVTLSDKKPTVVGKLSVTIQNRSLHDETITSLSMLSNLVTVVLNPLATNDCLAPVPQMVVPKKLPPYVLKPGKSIKIAYVVDFHCSIDPQATSKDVNHDDFEYVVTVHHEAIDSTPDSHTADDVCPRQPLGIDPINGKKDKGCGKKLSNGSLGPVTTDIVDKRP